MTHGTRGSGQQLHEESGVGFAGELNPHPGSRICSFAYQPPEALSAIPAKGLNMGTGSEEGRSPALLSGTQNFKQGEMPDK